MRERDAIHWVGQCMSIERESNGLPEMDPRRATTKVNLAVIAAVLLFLVGMASVVFWLSQR